MGRVATVLFIGVALAGAAQWTATEGATVQFPPSFLAREAVVLWQPAGVTGAPAAVAGRFTRPGDYELDFPPRAPDETTVRFEVRVLRGRSGRQSIQGDYRECSSDEVARIAREESGAGVCLRVQFRGADFGGPEGREFPVPRGAVAIAAGSGIVCVAPREVVVPAEVRAARPGDWLKVCGRAAPAGRDGTVISVDQIWFEEVRARGEEPPWTVCLLRGNDAVLAVSNPGLTTAQVGGPDSPKVHGTVGVRLREFRAVSLEVAGNPVTAELAATPAERRYGLQGRTGLAEDHGMLFVFRRSLRPRFVMKSVSFPLSIAFIRADGVITDIRRMEPGDQRGVKPRVPVNYVLEMEAGWFRRNGVVEGDAVTVSGGARQGER